MGPGRRGREASLWGSAVGRKRRGRATVGVPPLADLGVASIKLRAGLEQAWWRWGVWLRSVRGLGAEEKAGDRGWSAARGCCARDGGAAREGRRYLVEPARRAG